MASSLHSFKAALAVIGTSVVLAACGGGEESTNPGNDTGNNNGSAPEISATPAFLNRSCDGQQSPQLFCPNTNGG